MLKSDFIIVLHFESVFFLFHFHLFFSSSSLFSKHLLCSIMSLIVGIMGFVFLICVTFFPALVNLNPL